MKTTIPENYRLVNAKIIDASLMVSFASRYPFFRMDFELQSGGFVSLRIDDVENLMFPLMRIFDEDDGINLDCGASVESLGGKYVRCIFDSSDEMKGKLVGIGHIVKDRFFLKEEK